MPGQGVGRENRKWNPQTNTLRLLEPGRADRPPSCLIWTYVPFLGPILPRIVQRYKIELGAASENELILPESLGHDLGLREGDRVQVQGQDSVLWLRRRDASSPEPLTDLSRIISSSLPANSVDVESYMNKIQPASIT